MKVDVTYAKYAIYICKKNLKQVKKVYGRRHREEKLSKLLYFPKLDRATGEPCPTSFTSWAPSMGWKLSQRDTTCRLLKMVTLRAALQARRAQSASGVIALCISLFSYTCSSLSLQLLFPSSSQGPLGKSPSLALPFALADPED